MSIGTFFKGNFGIFATDYTIESLYYIYDYVLYRASSEGRSVIIYCTSKEKGKIWDSIVNKYDFPALVQVREVCKGLVYLYGVDNYYQDCVTPQSIIIVDGATDMYYGKQSMRDLSMGELEREYDNNKTMYSSILDMIEKREIAGFGDREEILDIFDVCPINMIFLLAECEEPGLGYLDKKFSGLSKHGDSILEIRKVGRTAEAYLLMKKKPRKLESIKKDLKEYDDLRSKNIKRKPFAIYL